MKSFRKTVAMMMAVVMTIGMGHLFTEKNIYASMIAERPSVPTVTFVSATQVVLRSIHPAAIHTPEDFNFGFVFTENPNATPTASSLDGLDGWTHVRAFWTDHDLSFQVTASNLIEGRTYFFFSYFYPHQHRGQIQFSNRTQPHVQTFGVPTVQWHINPTFNANVGHINAMGRLTAIGGSNVTEVGFVYSNTMTMPALNANGTPVEGSFRHAALTGQSIGTARDFDASFTPQFSPQSTSTTFHIRPYAINAQGIAYGEVRTVTNVPLNFANVTLGDFAVSGTTASAQVTVTGITAANLAEWGIVYSTTNRTPARTGNTANVHFVEGPRDSTSATITLPNLEPNATFFARAYARPRVGTGLGSYVYSPMREFQTTSDITLTMFPPQNATATSVLLSGNAVSVGGNILEMGFILSRINNQPTLQDMVVRLPLPQTGNFNITADRLTANVNYYVRAYATFGNRPQDIVFSETMTFRTAANTANITISYRDANGFELGTQMISSTVGSLLTARSLTNIPFGTTLQNPNWQHSVAGSDTVIVTVIQEGGGWDPPAQTPNPWDPPPQPGEQPGGRVPLQGYDPLNEQPFMQGIGQWRFGPENYGTYIEVAAMLYTLMADPFQTYTHPVWFPDVDYSNPVQANIVNFVASRGYMVGNDEGRFLTHEPINRAVVAVIISEVLNLGQKYEHETNGGAGFVYGGEWGLFRSAFPDTHAHWSRGFVWMAVQEGIISGSFDYNLGVNVFRPDDNVTRAELAVIFARIFNRSTMPMSFNNFVDVDPSHWAHTFIMNAAIPMD